MNLNVFEVLLGVVSANVCKVEEAPCDPTALDCCAGLACLPDSVGVYHCEPVEICESHAGHECLPAVHDCCPPLKCTQVSPTVRRCQ